MKEILIILLGMIVISYIWYIGSCIHGSYKEIGELREKLARANCEYIEAKNKCAELKDKVNSFQTMYPIKFFQVYGKVYAAMSRNCNIMIKDYQEGIEKEELARSYADSLVKTLNEGLEYKYLPKY
jgi:hypothetical protein